MQYSRQLALTLVSLVVIALFFSMEDYKVWFSEKIMKANKDIPEQLAYMEIEERKDLRWGSPYIVSKNVLENLKKNRKDKTALILLPPREMTKQGNINFSTPEPVVFYYYTGLRSKWANMPGADSANYAIVVNNGQIELATVDPVQVQALLSQFRKYTISL